MCARSNLQRKFVVVLAAAMRNRLLATRSDVAIMAGGTRIRSL
jgi:hypothetical protein